MAEDSLPWGGTSVGDAGPYTDDNWSDMYTDFFVTDRTTQGVIGGVANSLEVTNPAGTTIRVATGAAIVDGKYYKNTANIDFAVVAPGGGSNYYTVILRKDFTLQTVRAVLLGPNIVAPPAVTQTDGTTWEISIATVQITSGGVITVTDTRGWAIRALETKEEFIPTVGYVDSATPTNYYWYCPTGILSYALGYWKCPSDFAGDLEITPIMYASNTGNVYGNSSINYQSVGQTVGATHVLNSGYSACAIDTHLYAFTTQYPTLATVNDYFILSFDRDGTDLLDTNAGQLYVKGWKVTYTRAVSA